MSAVDTTPIPVVCSGQNTFFCLESNTSVHFERGVLALVAHIFGLNIWLEVIEGNKKKSLFIPVKEAVRVIGNERAVANERIGALFARVLHNQITISIAKKRIVVGNISEAVEWYTRAAEHGSVDAQCSLGWLYISRKNIAEAMRWYRRAAAGGDIRAKYALGYMWP